MGKGGIHPDDRLSARAVADAERAIETIELDAVLSGDDMNEIARALAHAFVRGYAAKLDDSNPAEALGGVAEEQRRRRSSRQRVADRQCTCGGRRFEIKSDGPNRAWLKCLGCGKRQPNEGGKS